MRTRRPRTIRNQPFLNQTQLIAATRHRSNQIHRQLLAHFQTADLADFPTSPIPMIPILPGISAQTQEKPHSLYHRVACHCVRVESVMTVDNSKLNEDKQNFIIRAICPLFLTLVVSR